MDNKSMEKTYACEKCLYNTKNRTDFVRHLKTQKHLLNIKINMDKKKTVKTADLWWCECGKSYKFQSGLCKHRNSCIIKHENVYILENTAIEEISSSKNPINQIMENETTDYKAIIMKLIDENAEFKNLIIKQQNQIGELIPKVGNNNTINNKQKFNINIFLNEQCKDALNMNDFLKQITVTLENLDITKSRGLTEGLSNVFIENMNKLSVFERPMHCTDAKRETLYIKENDTWEKDNDKSKIRDAIKSVSATQYKNMKQWMDANPDYMDDPDKQDYFIHMVKNCGKSINDIDDKIIKRLCLSSYIKDIMNEQINEQINE